MALHRMMSFAADPRSASAARTHVTTYLTDLQLLPPELVPDAALIISELVTNAILAVGRYLQYLQDTGQKDPEFPPEVWVYVGKTSTMVLLGVENQTHEHPERRDSDADSENGRGLDLTEALSKAFGWIELEEQDAKDRADDELATSLLVYAALPRTLLPRRRAPLNWDLAPDFVTGRLLGLRAMPPAPVAAAERVLAVCA